MESQKITARILEKMKDYEKYAFTPVQDCALKTFFDLAQEFSSQRDFYSICVLIPKIFFSLDCALYLSQPRSPLKLACRSEEFRQARKQGLRKLPPLYDRPTVDGDSFFIPLRANVDLLHALPHVSMEGILGLFEIMSGSELSEHMTLFFEKYVNRVAFQLHNRIVAEKNQEHIRFIKNLVNDIGHNVIVPNMYFKLFFRRLKGKIDRAKLITRDMKKTLNETRDRGIDEMSKEILPLHEELSYINEAMEEQFQQILAHYEQTSMFLETLLRRSHFEKGRYVIEAARVNFKEKIIRPQLNRYLPQLQQRQIAVDDQIAGIPDQEIMVVADVGLISQAYANFFSNAVKYTRKVRDEQGYPHKFIAMGMEILENRFGKGKDGIKFNLFSTGPHISPEDIPRLFDEGYRGKNVGHEYGTGHGLLFIKEVVELHGGEVGYEPTHKGNNFYFILPK